VNPLIDHRCCYECGNSLNDFFCYQCTCEICGNGAHVGYNCLAQVPSFQTLPSFPQQYPCCEDYEVLPKADHCQPPRYTVNHPIFNAHNDFLDSQNELAIAQNKIMEQITQLTSMCEMSCQIIQKKQEETRIEEEQAANARYWKIPSCCDDDDDYNSAITPNEPADSLSMGDEHLNTIPTTESDEFIKSCVENLVPNPSESEGEIGCDVPAWFTTFSNILFDADYESDSSDYQSCSDEDFSEEIFSNPLFEEEIIPMKIDQHHFNADDTHMEEIDLTFTLDDPMPPGIEEDDDESERDIIIREELPSNYSLSLPVPMPRLMITLASNQEKSPDLLSHRGLEIFKLSAKRPMMIHGKNIPTLDVPFFHFYPLDQLNCLVFSEIGRLLPKDFILQVFISSASIGNHVSKSYRLTFILWPTS
nr:hypothetical protein [Tanacetum cinerariifolium]